MIADQMPFPTRSADDLRLLLSPFTDYKKRRLDIFFSKDVEHSGGVNRAWSVVKSQRHAGPVAAVYPGSIPHQPLIPRMEQQVQHHHSPGRIDASHHQRA